MERKPLLGGDGSRSKWMQSCTSRAVKPLVWICLVLSCLDKLEYGLNYSITIYINDLKSTFNYTQTEACGPSMELARHLEVKLKKVEVIISVNNFGNGMLIFAGLFNTRFGTKITLITSLVVSTGSYLLIWNSAAHVNFYKDKVLLIASYFFLHGFGSNFGYIATLVTSIGNFKRKQVGKIIGIQDAMIGAGPIILSQVYYSLFKLPSNGETTTRYDFANFLLFNAILNACIDIFCLVFVNAYKSEYNDEGTEAKTDDVLNTDRNSVIDTRGSVNDDSYTRIITTPTENKMRFWDILRNPVYNFFLWTFVLLSCSDFVAVDNLTASGEALGFSDQNVITVSVWASCSFVSSLTTGIMVDYFGNRRKILHLLAPTIGGVGLLLYITAADQFSIFLLATVLTGITSGIMWVAFPSEVSDRFGNEQFGRNWGWIVTVQTLCTFPVEYVFGYLYELNISNDSIYCYGLNCIRSGYQLLLVTEVLAFSALLIRCIEPRPSLPQNEPNILAA